ncbi:MAG: DUF898 family protein [Clostridia bacterium]|nr:DUF898 family protein [Clostridia bacterium]
MKNERSYFDGKLSQLVGYQILGFLITALTLGLCYPIAITMICSWEAKHTVIDGKRLKFTGTSADLFVQYIKWWLLTAVTLGIYSFWLVIKIRQWKTSHLTFE